MNRPVAGFTAGLVVGAALASAALVGRSLKASDGSVQGDGSAQSVSRVVLENDRVRVRDVTFAPGVTPMHTHDLPHVGVVIQGGTLVFRSPDGTFETMRLDPGGVGFREANVSHEPTNPGQTPVRVIEVELKPERR